jgi:acetylglutamate kinase
MIPKIESCLVALKHGAGSAHIANGTSPHTLLKALLTKEHEGTMIRSTEES